jgi:tRNA dimethylallyltransferase
LRPPGPIPLITGPTAVGKTSIAIRVAERIGAEIVSADSRQVYREFGVAVDKPSADERTRVRHHLVDSRSVREPMSAGIYAREAEACIAGILDRGVIPLVVGGSTLYLQALVFGLSDIPEVPAEVRDRVRARLASDGPEALHGELRSLDPEFARTLDATKTQRVLRGLEVFETTGRPLSSFFGSVPAPGFTYDIVVLTRDRAELYRRIDERVSEMLARGLVAEARRLASAGLDLEANPTRTIGYAEAAPLLRGEQDESGMAEAIRRHSRHYAKRQLTWLRRFEGASWLDLTATDPDRAVDLLVRRFAGA